MSLSGIGGEAVTEHRTVYILSPLKEAKYIEVSPHDVIGSALTVGLTLYFDKDIKSKNNNL